MLDNITDVKALSYIIFGNIKWATEQFPNAFNDRSLAGIVLTDDIGVLWHYIGGCGVEVNFID